MQALYRGQVNYICRGDEVMRNQDWYLNIDDYSNPRTVKRYEVTMNLAEDIVNYNWTVREAARNYCIGKTTVSRWINTHLKWLDNDLYWEVKNKLNFHKKNTSAWRKRL